MAFDPADIENDLKATVGDHDIAVETNAFGDITVVVTASRFTGLSDAEREELVANLFDNQSIERVITLAPEEAVDPDTRQLTELTWPEALARSAETRSTPVFPTDLDTDIEIPIVTAFYSLRGGVGRSTALAHTGRELASRGRSVILVDMDFEAPGLAALFGVEQVAPTDGGLPRLLLELEQDSDAPVSLSDRLIRLDDAQELYLLPAGAATPEYARVLSLLAPDSWTAYEPSPIRKLIDGLAQTAIAPDVILIDSRTGLSPISAPILFDACDLAVVCFFPHPQAEYGTAALTQALLASTTRRAPTGPKFTPEPRFLVSPVPAGSGEIRKRYELRASDWITNWLAPTNKSRPDVSALNADELMLVVPYRESAASSDQIGNGREERAPYAGLADWIEALVPEVPVSVSEPGFPTDKTAVLSSLVFSSGTAESQERFSEAFVATEVVERALRIDIPLILGRKGTGKTAVFRRLLETAEAPIPVTTPDAFKHLAPWGLSPAGYQAVEDAVEGDWRFAWQLLIAIAASSLRSSAIDELIPSEFASALADCVTNLSERSVVSATRAVASVGDAQIIVNEWLDQLADMNATPGLLLFDGLDTGFGSTSEQRDRRRRAIEALVPLALTTVGKSNGLRFKILLREDIWRTLTFQNKSHFFGRSVSLQWQDQTDYLRTAVKQALLTEEFKGLLADRVDLERPLEHWPADDVLTAWNALVGERMKGGKTTFTRNWVWNRLADGNGDHGPRSLLQLFFAARQWEEREERNSPYDRSVIRPRALIESLTDVSSEALSALQEEFEELGPLVDLLKSIGRTPLDANELRDLADLTDLGREVGLLEIYEGPEDAVRRYRIPDLFRLGLGMTRMGQI